MRPSGAYYFFLGFADFIKTKISRFKEEKLAVTGDHEIPLKILEFILNSIQKFKSGFLLSSICFLNRMGQNPNLAAFTSKIKGFAYQNGPKGEGTP